MSWIKTNTNYREAVLQVVMQDPRLSHLVALSPVVSVSKLLWGRRTGFPEEAHIPSAHISLVKIQS